MKMKMKGKAFFRKLNLLIALGGVLVGLIFYGCDNLLASTSPDTPTASLAQTQVPAKEGYGIVNGVLPSATNSSARTAMPSTAVTVVSYKVFAQNASNRIEANVNDANATFSIALPYGTWSITARGLDAGGKIVATETKSVTLDAANPSVNINFKLGYSTDSADGDGKASLSVSFPAALIHGVEYTLSKGATKISKNIDATELGAGGFAIERTFEDLGAWHLTIKFYGDFSNLVYRIDQTVNVYANLTTDKFVGSAPYISGGDIVLTPTLLAEFQNTTLYVNAEHGKDTNSGTQFDPLQTFNRAVELVNNSAHDPSTEFRIFLQTDVNDGAELELKAGKKLTVASVDAGDAVRTVRSLGRTFAVKSEGASASELAVQSVKFEKLRFEIDGDCTFTMNGGGISGNNITALGGAIYCSGTANISGATFSDNTAGDDGGAICITSGSTVTLEDCTFSGNKAKSGGAICINGGLLTVKGSTKISGNTAQDGGGVCLNVGTFTMTGGTITENEALGNGTDGGGVHLNGGTFTMSGATSTISKNKASYGGGVQIGNGGTFTMAGGTITENEALGNGTEGGGGGVHIYKGTFTMNGGAISKNECAGSTDDSGGGGIFIYNDNTVTINGGTISENISSMKGGGIYLMPGGTLKMTDGAISANAASTNGGGVYIKETSTFTMSGGAISGNTANSSGGAVYIYEGTFTMEGATSAITGNTATNSHGGGVCVTDGGTFTMKAGTIGGSAASEKNTAKVRGGAVYVNSDSTFTMEGGTITGNTADSNGGAVYVNTKATFTMEGATSEISENSASVSGGGVFVGGDFDTHEFGTFTMKGGSITGNKAMNATSGAGGGVCVYNGAFTMEGGTISENIAYGTGGENFGGGGIFLYRTTTSMLGGTFTMKGGTVSRNEAKFGGGIWTSIYSEFEMSGGTFSDNIATNNGKGNGAYVTAYSSFKMSSAAKFAENNDVYLGYSTYTQSGVTGDIYATIIVDGALTAATPVATITPYSYDLNRYILTHGSVLITQDICKQFALTPDPDEEEWKIAPNGTGSQGVLLANSDIYVRGTGATAFPSAAALGSDSNTGTLMRPFATIQKALDTVIARNDGVDEYTIYIDGTLDGTTAAYLGASGMADFSALDKELTLTIKALSESAKATLDGGARFDSNGTVTNAGIGKGVIFAKSKPDTDGKINLTLENLVIKGGNKTGNGAGVYLNSPGGTLTIGDGTTISGNRGRFGGGVSINSGAFTMTGGTVSGNWSTENSGGVDIGSGGASFTMTGGTISDNTAQYGGGMLVASDGTVTMSGGEISGNTATGNGGGVYNRGTFTISGSAKISGNNASQDGGGVYVIKQDEKNADFTMSGGEINGKNTAKYGGGVYVASGGTFTMDDGAISDNKVEGENNSGGGGVNVYGGTFTMNGGTISGNEAKGTSYGGGGVYVFVGQTFTMNGGTISKNIAENDGGGVYNSGGTVTIEDGTISENVANYGGGVYVMKNPFATQPGVLTMKKGTISGNTARGNATSNDGGGGGVYLNGSEFTMSGGTISGNEVTKGSAEGSGGGGIYLYASSTFTMTGGTVSGNTVPNDQGKGAFISPNCTFNMRGSAKFAADDDVYLYSIGSDVPTITVTGPLTAASPVATITPSAYTPDRKVLSKGPSVIAIAQSICKQFALSEEGWKIAPSADGTAGVLMSTTFYVASTGSDTNSGDRLHPFATIQKAVDTVIAQNDGASAYTIYIDGTLQCDDSTYVGAEGMADFSALDKNLTLTIKALSSTATLDAGGTSRVIYAKPTSGALNLTLENLVITGGKISGAGGGICFRGKTLEMTGCTISDCTANSGGGIGVGDTATVTFKDSTISGCKAVQLGGGVTIASGGTFNMSGTAKITGCSTTATTASFVKGGGGICSSGTFAMSGGTISGCTTKGLGGGVYNLDGTFAMSGGKISGCTGTGGGACIDDGTFTMSGAASIPAGTSGNNNVYLIDSGKITVAGELTAASPVATIMLLTYPAGRQVLRADGTNVTVITQDICDKFALKTTAWKIVPSETAQSGVLAAQ